MIGRLRLKKKYVFLIIMGIGQASVLVGAVFVTILATNGVESIERKWDSLNKLENINGCVDEYTNLPYNSIQQEYRAGKNYEVLVIIFSIVIIWALVMQLSITTY